MQKTTRDALDASLRKRIDDWMYSTSEYYARETVTDGRWPGDRWLDGLRRYLLEGPGALLETVAGLMEEKP